MANWMVSPLVIVFATVSWPWASMLPPVRRSNKAKCVIVPQFPVAAGNVIAEALLTAPLAAEFQVLPEVDTRA